jgi:hypothetical protein
MVFDPVATLVVYVVGFLFVVTLIAAVADLWLARTERQLRDQARAEARAERMNGEASSLDAWL